VPREALLELRDRGYRPGDVRALAEALGREPSHAATVLSSWTAAGLSPDVSRLAALAAAGVPDLRISAPALGRLIGGVGDPELPDAVAAELLVVWGNVPEALACARAGRTDPLEIARVLYRASPSS
jgi:hypothetical protein